MLDSREVCKICFGSTSHKPNPTLTPDSKATYDQGQKKKKCTVCRQEWAPIRVAKELSNGKWVRIRIRPKIPASIDYQLCKNFQSKVECPKGQECSFSHSKVELAIWNCERQNEPRPAPPINSPHQYQLCKHMLNTGSCPYGQRCTFAHTEEERKHWLRVHAAAGGDGSVPVVTNGGFIPGVGFNPPQPMMLMSQIPTGEYRCDVCGLTCTSKKQLEDHFAGSRHRQMSTKSVHPQYVPHQQPPRLSIPSAGYVRRKPTLAFPINGYKMCLHTQAGRRCVYEEFCTFAHSQHELDEWNRQLQHASKARASQHINRFQSAGYGGPSADMYPNSYSTLPDDLAPPISNITSSGLDDFEDEVTEICQDFDRVVRMRLMDDHNKNSVSGFEETVQNVTINEVSGRDLCLLWSQATAIDWVFEITTSSLRILHSVTLFDSFSSDFNITGTSLITFNGQQKLQSIGKADKGVGILVNQKINQNDKVQVKVTLIPRSGLLGQLILFDFGSFLMVRGVVVHVLTEVEAKMLDVKALAKKKPQKTDLYWEKHNQVVPIETQYLEETDKELPEYSLPEQVEAFIKSGKYTNVEVRVTQDNYCRRMHNLLYLEEYKQREDMSRYDLYDIEITTHKDYNTQSGVQYATNGYHFIKVTLEETLFEGGRSIRMGDGALLLPSNHPLAYECNVEHVGRESVILKITDMAKQASNGNRCSIRFVLSRIQMRCMHYAVDHLDLTTIFPEPSSDGIAHNNRSTAVFDCIKELKNSELYQSQQNAIQSMLDPACLKVPSLVLGPFGCGKTRTLTECVQLLATMVPESCILICTHSNSAANLYVESIDKMWRSRYSTKAPLFRLYYTGRMLSTIPTTVTQYCRFVNGQLALPSVADLKQYRIIVATLMTARSLSLVKLPRGHFSHIFIDEAAQALEAESIIPLCLADSRTKIVLAGDHMQLDPPVHSHLARKYRLHVSLLERLYDHNAYNSGIGLLCKTLLTENHRSHEQILELPSKLFYKNKLTCRAVFPQTGPKDIPAIKFVGVSGQEKQEEDSPSFYNDHEVIKIVEQVQLLMKGGLAQTEICVLSYYRSQVFKIRHMLRKKFLSQVIVFRVDEVQGHEYRALLLSTVRTCSTEPPAEEEAGFLTNPKLFNTAVTRAKEWLIVVGEPFTLCTVGENRLCWMEYIHCCQNLNSFDYANADQFVEESLDLKIVARQLLEKVHEKFFKRMLSHEPTKTPPSSTPSSHPSIAYVKANAQQQQEMLRAKVSKAVKNSDEPTIRRITDEFLKMTLEQQADLMTRPDEVLAERVRGMEQVFRRAGPTAAILNTNRMEAPLLSHSPLQGVHTTFTPQSSIFDSAPQHGAVGSNVAAPTVPVSNGSLDALTGDLPPYLRSAMDSVMAYAKWVESMLQNPQLSVEIRENMLKQQGNVNQQKKLVNEQIILHREMLKLFQKSRPPPSHIPHPPQQGAPPPSTVTMGMGKMPMPPVVLGTSHNQVGVVAPRHQQPSMMPTQQYKLFAQPFPCPPMVAHQPFSHAPVVTGLTQRPFSQPPMVPHQSFSQAPMVVGQGATRSVPEDHGKSAFSFGVSALLPNNSQNLTHPSLSLQTNPVPGLVSGGRDVNHFSPLEAALSESSNLTTSSHGNHKSDQELYISDDELFN